MIYVVKKLRHYILGDSCIFFIDHQTLLYLMNKPIITWQIARWILLSQEFDFEVIYKLSRIHLLFNHLSRISHGELVEGIKDHLSDAHLFNMKVDWYGSIIKYF
jgi:hypothetical protein